MTREPAMMRRPHWESDCARVCAASKNFESSTGVTAVGRNTWESFAADSKLCCGMYGCELRHYACFCALVCDLRVLPASRRGDGLLQFKFERVFCEGLIQDVAIFYSGREPRGEPGGDGEWDARGRDG
jgi:hypothetical protein